MSSVPCSKSICLPKTSPCVSRRDYSKNSPRRSRRECFGGSSRRTGTPERKPYTIYTLYFSGECRIPEGRASAIGSRTANARAQRASPLCSRSNPVTLAHTISILRAPDAAVPTNILVQFEMIELIEGFLLVFPAHVYSSFLRNFQHPIVVSISRSPAG